MSVTYRILANNIRVLNNEIINSTATGPGVAAVGNNRTPDFGVRTFWSVWVTARAPAQLVYYAET